MYHLYSIDFLVFENICFSFPLGSYAKTLSYSRNLPWITDNDRLTQNKQKLVNNYTSNIQANFAVKLSTRFQIRIISKYFSQKVL
jgi:hypothetical protein